MTPLTGDTFIEYEHAERPSFDGTFGLRIRRVQVIAHAGEWIRMQTLETNRRNPRNPAFWIQATSGAEAQGRRT